MNEPDTANLAAVKAAIERAIAILGTEQKLADACDVRQSYISKAKLTGVVSAPVAKRIHIATRGEVPGSETRPDLWASPEAVPVEIPAEAAAS